MRGREGSAKVPGVGDRVAAYELSATYAANIVRVAKQLGHFEDTLPALSDADVQVLRAPGVRSWMEAGPFERFTEAAVVAHGLAIADRIGHEVVRTSIGPIVMPLVKVLMAVMGTDPAVLYARLDKLSSVAIRGLTFEWASMGKLEGVQTVTFPDPVPLSVGTQWGGAMRYVVEVTGRSVLTHALTQEGPGRFTTRISWS